MTPTVNSDKELGNALSRRAKKLWRRLSRERKNGLRRPDADAIRDLRVATRRVQTLIDVSSLGKPSGSDCAKLRKRMKRLRHALGGLRDIDVMLGRLRAAARNSASAQRRRLLWSVARRLGPERKRQSKLMRRELKRIDGPKVRRLYRHVLLSGHFNRLSIGALRDAMEQAERKLMSTVERAVAHEDPRTYHDVRIKAKTLRYTIELAARFVAVANADSIIEWLKGIQDEYGQWHDEVEECRRVTELLSSGPDKQSDPAATELISSLRGRTGAHTRFVRGRLRSVRGALGTSKNPSLRSGHRSGRGNRPELALEIALPGHKPLSV